MEGYLLDDDDLFYSLPEEDVDDVAEFDVLLEDCDEDFEEERQTISPAPSTSKAKGKGRKNLESNQPLRPLVSPVLIVRKRMLMRGH